MMFEMIQREITLDSIGKYGKRILSHIYTNPSGDSDAFSDGIAASRDAPNDS